MQVRQVMTSPVRFIESSATLQDAAELMRDEDVGALPVTEGGRPIGMLTDRDIVVRAVADLKDPAQVTVREAITPRLSTIYLDQDVAEAASVMAADQLRRLLVIDHDQQPVGVLSLGDIAKSQSTTDATAEAAKGVSEPERPQGWQNRTHP